MIETECQVRNFALVNVHHSEYSFAKLCKFVKLSDKVRELNVSWQYLRPSSFYQLLEVISENRKLESLIIAWNKLLELQ